jgi:hypothetical protein
MGDLGRTLAKWLLKQGVTEDICGTTLEAKWLRPTDPNGRVGGPPSLTDAWLNERGSGVRRSELGPLNTLPAPPRGATTDPDVVPESEAALALGQRPDVPSTRVFVGVVGVLLLGLAGFAMGKRLLAPSSVALPAAVTRTEAAPAPTGLAPAPVPVAALPEEPAASGEAPAAGADAEKRARATADKVSSSSARGSGLARGAKSTAAPAAKRGPSSGGKAKAAEGKPADLMSPY